MCKTLKDSSLYGLRWIGNYTESSLNEAASTYLTGTTEWKGARSYEGYFDGQQFVDPSDPRNLFFGNQVYAVFLIPA